MEQLIPDDPMKTHGRTWQAPSIKICDQQCKVDTKKGSKYWNPKWIAPGALHPAQT